MATLMQTRVLDRVVELCARVRARPGCSAFPVPEVYFYDKRRAAGLAHLNTHRIGINHVLLEENPESMLRGTVAHEVAHLVVYWQWKEACRLRREKWGAGVALPRRPAPHGCEWRAVMRDLFGVEPERTHTYSLANVRVRRQRRWAYACPCQVHKVTTVKHKRMDGRAHLFRCGACHSPLNFLGEVP